MFSESRENRFIGDRSFGSIFHSLTSPLKKDFRLLSLHCQKIALEDALSVVAQLR
jgi:hypothetical protein